MFTVCIQQRFFLSALLIPCVSLFLALHKKLECYLPHHGEYNLSECKELVPGLIALYISTLHCCHCLFQNVHTTK